MARQSIGIILTVIGEYLDYSGGTCLVLSNPLMVEIYQKREQIAAFSYEKRPIPRRLWHILSRNSSPFDQFAEKIITVSIG